MKILKYKGEIIFCCLSIFMFLSILIIAFAILLILLYKVDWLCCLLIALSIIFALVILIGIIFLILIYFTKDKYYTIQEKGITYYSNNKAIRFIDWKNIRRLSYMKWWYLVILQIGAGEMHIDVINQVYNQKTDKCFVPTIGSDEEARITFRVSKKQSEKMSKILGIDIEPISFNFQFTGKQSLNLN